MDRIRTISNLKKNPERVVGEAKRSGQPIVIVKGGSPQCVLLSHRVFEKRLKKLNLARLLAESGTAFRERRYRPADDVIRDIRRDYGP